MSKTHSLALAHCSTLALASGLMMAVSPAHAQGFPPMDPPLPGGGGPGGALGSFQAEGIVAEGAATIIEDIGITDITVETESAVIDWLPFDDSGVGDILFQDAGTTAFFTNGDGITDFTVLNRIIPVNLSQRIILDGNIVSLIQDGMNSTAGGTVYFYTPGGIVIGSNATFDVGNFGLTTAAPVTDGNGNFVLNDTVTFQQSNSFASIEIQDGAQISALSEGSYVALFAPRITQRGDITVNGQAALVAGEAGSITFSPDGLFDITVDIGTDAGFAIDHAGTTGGPGSGGGTDNHRVYMVGVAKNTAMTMLIEGGSELGFDIANVATMDGDAVVLSAGHNIVRGEIADPAVSFAQNSIQISDEENGFGQGALFTSDAIGRATDTFTIQSDVTAVGFEGDAKFAAGEQISLNLNSAFNGTKGSMFVGGDLELIADAASFGADAGGGNVNLFTGTTLSVEGNMALRSNALADINGDGRIQSGSTQIFVEGDGAVLSVGGDLTVDSSSIADTVSPGIEARGGFARLSAQEGASIDVGGRVRVSSDAIAFDGGQAVGGGADLIVFGGATVIAGELSVSSDAFGGDSMAANGGQAIAGNASIFATGTGSSIAVLAPNSDGRDFLSSEAFGGESTNGSGGAASSAGTSLVAQAGTTLTLPDVVGSPLFIRNSTVGGDSLANSGEGGSASTGSVTIRAIGGTHNLGRLSIEGAARGGSAANGKGGAASLGTVFFEATDADVTVAVDDWNFEARGGEGSSEGGAASSGGTSFFVANSTLNIPTSLVLAESVVGGDSNPVGGIGGAATGGSNSPFFDNSTVNIGGDFRVLLAARSGNGTGTGNTSAGSSSPNLFNASLNINGAFEIHSSARGGDSTDLTAFGSGGVANGGFIGLVVRDSTLTASEGVSAGSTTRGGSVGFGFSGDATSNETFVTIVGTSTIDTPNFDIFTTTIGGGEIGDAGNIAGNANGNRAEITITGDQMTPVDVVFTGNVSAISTAIGGNTPEFQLNGGNATSGAGSLVTRAPGQVTIEGNLFAASRATGGVGGTGNNGQGGNATSGLAEIFAIADTASIQINGDATFESTATGGDGGRTGGNANAGVIRIIGQGQDIVVDGALTIIGNAIAGNAVNSDTVGSGGAASGGFVEIDPRNNPGGTPTLISAGSLSVTTLSQGGNGADGVGGDGGLGGAAAGGGGAINGRALNGTLRIIGDTVIDQTVRGGKGGDGLNGGAGGNAELGAFTFGTTSGGQILDDVGGAAIFSNVNITSNSIGGDGGAASDGIGGDGGRGRGISHTILSSGGELSAETLSVTSNGIGGNGGMGTTAGNGGDGIGGELVLLVSEAFDNPGRGRLNLGEALLRASGQGGTGAVAGDNAYSPGGAFLIQQADATIGSLVFDIQGDVAATDDSANGMTFPVVVSPIDIAFTDATLNVGALEVSTPGELRLDAIQSDVTGSTISIGAGAMVLADIDPNSPPGMPGTISATDELVLQTTTGNVATNAALQSEANLIINSAESILVGDLNAADIFLTLGADDAILDAGGINAPDGSVSVEALGTLVLPEIFNTPSLLVRSLTGDILGDAPIDIAGQFTAVAELGSVLVGDVNAGAITLTAANGALASGALNAVGGTVNLQSGESIELGSITADSIIASSTGGDITAPDPIALSGLLDLNAFGAVSVTEANVGAINLTAQNGAILSAALVAQDGAINLNAADFIDLGFVDANTLTATSAMGGISSDDLITLTGQINLSAAGSITLSDVVAASMVFNSINGLFSADSLVANGGSASITSEGAITVGLVNTDVLLANSLAGDITFDGPVEIAGLAELSAFGSIFFGSFSAGSLSASGAQGDIEGDQPINIAGDAFFDTGGSIRLGNVSAMSISAASSSTTQINGLWEAGLVEIASPFLEILDQGQVNTGPDGRIALTSTNPQGFLLANDGPADFEGYLINAAVLERLQAGELSVLAGANMDVPDIAIGDIDLSTSDSIGAFAFTATDPAGQILLDGNVVASGAAPVDLSFNSAQFRINTSTGSINLLGNGGTVSIAARTVAVAEGSVLDQLTGDETPEQLAELLNAPAQTANPDGVLTADQLVIFAGDRVLIQNTGTEEAPAGFVVPGADGIVIGGESNDGVLAIINGQVGDLTGDDAATAILDSLTGEEGLAPASLINGCELGGCTLAPDGAGEATSTVSAAVNGVNDVGNTNTGGDNSGGATGGDAGSGGGEDSSGGDGSESSEESGGASAGAGVNAGSAGTEGGGEVNVDNVDDGGGGNEDFVIEDSDSGDASGGDDGSSGEGDADSDGGSEESEGDSEGEDSESEDSEDSEESEEEESEEEEESSEEEEEDSEGPATGPIAPPVSIINTQTLERRGVISDPISGLGNPALVDPDIDGPVTDGNGGQQ